MNELITALIVLNTILTGGLIVLLAVFKRSIPDIQEVLSDVGESIGEQLTGVFEKPIVKGAMSQLGKQSGVVRADAALKNRVAEKALGKSVVVKKALDYFGLTALEGIELMQDPTFGPLIRGFVEKGSQGLLGGFGGRKPHNSGGQRGRGVPLMS